MGPKSSLRLGLWFATVLSLMAAGCGPSAGPAKTVSYFQAHPKEREAVFKRCADDPGTLGKTAECVNAERAEEVAGIGSFRHLAPMQFRPVPGARAKKAADASVRNSAPSR
jgi:hypothetical protein